MIEIKVHSARRGSQPTPRLRLGRAQAQQVRLDGRGDIVRHGEQMAHGERVGDAMRGDSSKTKP